MKKTLLIVSVLGLVFTSCTKEEYFEDVQPQVVTDTTNNQVCLEDIEEEAFFLEGQWTMLMHHQWQSDCSCFQYVASGYTHYDISESQGGLSTRTHYANGSLLAESSSYVSVVWNEQTSFVSIYENGSPVLYGELEYLFDNSGDHFVVKNDEDEWYFSRGYSYH